MESPTVQLLDTLSNSIQIALKTHRPILTHLNADTTWLLQLPRPRRDVSVKGRSRYNLVFDPWLQGPQSDMAAWFSTQWHAIKSSVQSIQELNELLKEINDIEMRQELHSRPNERRTVKAKETPQFIDAIVISHEFSDHCNKDTLLEFHPETPVFAIGPAADLITSWDHFKTVQVIPPFSAQDPDWRKGSTQPLPDWLGITRITSKSDALHYHSAILIAFDLKFGPHYEHTGNDKTGEAIVYTPHGIHAQTLGQLSSATPSMRTLALLHGLHDISLSPFKQLNLGAHNGLKAQRICQAKYWISTHDEAKGGGGLVAWFLKRKVITLQEAVQEEEEKTGQMSASSAFDKVIFAELRNGESILLT